MGSMKKTVAVLEDQRRSPRRTSSVRVAYSYSQNESGRGICRNVGRDGLCLKIGRYLRPGRRLLMTIRGAEVMGRVMWCRADGGSHEFLVGVKVFHDEEETALALAAAETTYDNAHAQPSHDGEMLPRAEGRMHELECSVC